MADITQKLMNLKKELQEQEKERSKLEGKNENLYERLKKETGLNSVEEAKEEIKVIEEKVNKYKKEYDKGIKEIEEEYEL